MRSWFTCRSCTIVHCQAVRRDVKPVGRGRHARVYSQTSARSSYTASQDWKRENPDFDDIELNEDYYRSLGISEEELADQLSFLASDADPMGADLGPEDLESQQLGASSYLMDEDMNETTWGPQVDDCPHSFIQTSDQYTPLSSCLQRSLCVHQSRTLVYNLPSRSLLSAGNFAGRLQS